MNISIFEILGPVMIGPSSSHTAGAAKLARTAAAIAAKPFLRVQFALSGSFAKTGLGHGTHQALLAGAIGLREDDERLRVADKLAKAQG
ncbi:MAG: serine dehydratase beta chain, partial [Pygmaiobacter massiliensis]|nr:serine dehydratase beta chain [Pygmaiobacter massiliensis]